MSAVYSWLSMLPFDFTQTAFMQRAFVAVVLSSVMFGMIGTLAVDNKMAFFSDALGHSAATGIAIGIIIGVKNELICLIAFGILMALLINRVRSDGAASTDTIISVFSSTALAVGLLLLSKTRSSAQYSSYLIGDILSVSESEIILLIIALVVVVAIWCVCYNKFLLLSINQSLAASRGIKVVLYENIFTCLIAVVVMLSIKWVGILLINSMLILPAAAARNVARGVRSYNLLSVLFAIFSGIAGLIFSWYLGTAAGAMIVTISSVIFFSTFIIRVATHK